MHMLTKPQVFYDDTHKQALGYQNPFYLKKVQRIKPTLYDGSVISNQHAVIPVIDDEETLILEDDVLLTVMDSTIAYGDFVNLEMQSESCDKCFDLDAELLKKQNAYNELLKSYSQLEKHSQLQAKDTTICKLKEHIKSMRENNKEEKVKQDMDEIETINIELEYSVAKLLSENECLHKEIDHLKQIYKDQFDSIKKTRVRNKEHSESLIAQLNSKSDQADILRGIVEQAKAKQTLDNALDFTYVPSSSSLVNDRLSRLFSGILDSRCSKHMTGNRSQLMNFVSKFLGTVRFENDQIEKIMGYGDYQLGNVTISRAKFLRSKDETLEAIIKCIKNIQVCLNSTVQNVRTDNGTEFVNQTLHEFYENVSITHQTSVARTPQQNGVVERRNQTLVEAAHTMLIFSKDPLFLWAEAINTTCYTQNRLRYNKTPYELMHDKNPDLLFLHVFGSLCYPTNDSGDLGKLNAKADIGFFVGYAPAKESFRIYNRRTRKIMETIHVTFDELTMMASEQFSLGLGPQLMTPGTSSSRLVPNPVPQQPFNLPTINDWDRLFQPMFDEYFNSPSSVEEPIPNAPFDDPCHEPLHEISTSQESSSNRKSSHPPLEMIGKWTKDHPLENVIRNPS
ncbi:retrovirus-related pol polyprotein from transposon TNT 1-94 [Tanacetum coccineum]|uniref:Retrovirus-related pol polyprotein from transposon TNT 1-94 n=1 Tax=Tanacetum coccineum TaxID=301880 RepID=A0ABQ5J554_9ASTR